MLLVKGLNTKKIRLQFSFAEYKQLDFKHLSIFLSPFGAVAGEEK